MIECRASVLRSSAPTMLPDLLERRFVAVELEHQRAVVKRGEEHPVVFHHRRGDADRHVPRLPGKSPKRFTAVGGQAGDAVAGPADEHLAARLLHDERRGVLRRGRRALSIFPCRSGCRAPRCRPLCRRCAESPGRPRSRASRRCPRSASRSGSPRSDLAPTGCLPLGGVEAEAGAPSCPGNRPGRRAIVTQARGPAG